MGGKSGKGGCEIYCFTKVWQLHNFRLQYELGDSYDEEAKSNLEGLQNQLYFGKFGTGINDLQVCHTCGEDACCNPEHTTINTKKYNDEQRECHGVLNRTSERDKFLDIDCGHNLHCF